MKELIDRYRASADEGMVAITSRQMAEAIGYSRQTCERALAHLDSLRFVSREVSHFEEKHKPSRYRLNLFPLKGEPAKHEYALGNEWNQINKRKAKPTEASFRLVATANIRESGLVAAAEAASKAGLEIVEVHSKPGLQ